MDGREHRPPTQRKGFIAELEEHCAKSAGKVASIIGRYYAMDRDKRWERVKIAYDLLVHGEGKKATDMVEAMQESPTTRTSPTNSSKPIVNATVDGTIKAKDVVIFFNYRNDRAKEITSAPQHDMPEGRNDHPHDLQYYCMTPLRCIVHRRTHPLSTKRT